MRPHQRTCLLPFLSIAASCAVPGERAEGGCPEGESCSDLTPGGLAFVGARFGDDPIGSRDALSATAVGGRQYLEVFDQSLGAPLRHPYQASSDVAGLTIASTRENVVGIVASAPATGRLLIHDVDGALMDRIAIAAVPIARVHLTSSWLGDYTGGSQPAKVWVGTNPRLVVALSDVDGNRIVDEEATVVPAGGGGLVRWSWDEFRAPNPLESDTSIVVRAGGTEHALTIEVVDRLDRVEPVAMIPELRVEVGDSAVRCFSARVGAAHVVGAPWQFTVTGPASVTPDDSDVWDNCAVLQTTDVGTVTVTATIGSLFATTTVTVLPRTSERSTRHAVIGSLPAIERVLGELAR